MVNTEQAMESEFLDASFVDRSPTKVFVPTGEGGYSDVTYEGEAQPVRRLTIPGEIDGKKKLWRPNRESVENLQVIGADSRQWIGQRILLRCRGTGNYRSIVAYPADAQPVSSRVPDGKLPPQASPASSLRKLPESEIPAYAKGPGVEYSKGKFTTPPGYQESGEF